jgi:cobalt-zinc-cadmium efflux system membrane fusion protein
MMLANRFRAGLVVFACGALTATAGDIRITPEQLAQLGITLAQPEPVDRIDVADATARVVIPPMREFVVTAPQSGLIVRLDVADGDRVAEGQVLARLRSNEFLTLQREYLEALNHARLARSELTRDRELFDEGIIAERRLREAESGARVAEAVLSEHRQMLRMGGVQAAELEALDTHASLLDTLGVRAPAAGVVLARMVANGERVAATAPLYRIADLTELWLEIAVPQERAATVRTGMPVTLGDAPDRAVGTITRVGQSVDPATQSVKTRALLTGSDHGLRPGQFLSVRILAEAGDDPAAPILAVPVGALVRDGDDSRLFVRTPDGFEVRVVDIVGAGPDRVFVRGLAAAERIAVTGVSALKVLLADTGETG